MCQDYLDMSFLLGFFRYTHTWIHRKTFMEHPIGTICLDNMDPLRNVKSALCDVRTALSDMEMLFDVDALCNMSAL